MKIPNKLVIRLEKVLAEKEYSFKDFYLNFYSEFSKRTYQEFLRDINDTYAYENFLPEAHILAFNKFKWEIIDGEL
jgi:hypothetical protein